MDREDGSIGKAVQLPTKLLAQVKKVNTTKLISQENTPSSSIIIADSGSGREGNALSASSRVCTRYLAVAVKSYDICRKLHLVPRESFESDIWILNCSTKRWRCTSLEVLGNESDRDICRVVEKKLNKGAGLLGVYGVALSTSSSLKQVTGKLSAIISMGWYETHTIVYIGIRNDKYTLEIVSKDVSSSSMSAGLPKPLVQHIIVLPEEVEPLQMRFQLVPTSVIGASLPLLQLTSLSLVVVIGNGSAFNSFTITAAKRNFRESFHSSSYDNDRSRMHGTANIDEHLSGSIDSYYVRKTVVLGPATLVKSVSMSPEAFALTELAINSSIVFPITKASPVVIPASLKSFMYVPYSVSASRSEDPAEIFARCVTSCIADCEAHVRHIDRDHEQDINIGAEVGLAILDSAKHLWIISPTGEAELICPLCDDFSVASLSSLMSSGQTESSLANGELLHYMLIEIAGSEMMVWFPFCSSSALSASSSRSTLCLLLHSGVPIMDSQATTLNALDTEDEDCPVDNSLVDRAFHIGDNENFVLLGKSLDRWLPHKRSAALSLSQTALSLAFAAHTEYIRVLKENARHEVHPTFCVNRIMWIRDFGSISLNLLRRIVLSQSTQPKQLNALLHHLEKQLLALVYELAELKSKKDAKYKHSLRKYRVLMSIVCHSNENMFLELLSRVCRKIEPELSEMLFPLPIKVFQSAENSEVQLLSEPFECLFETKLSVDSDMATALSLYEAALRRGRLTLASRLLTLACESIGGADSNLSRIISLAIALELLWLSINLMDTPSVPSGTICRPESHTHSLSLAVQCTEFCLRLEELMMAIYGKRLAKTFEKICSDHVNASTGLLCVRELLNESAVEHNSGKATSSWLSYFTSYFVGSDNPSAPSSSPINGTQSYSNICNDTSHSHSYQYLAFGLTADRNFCAQQRYGCDLTCAKHTCQSLEAILISLRNNVSNGQVIYASSLITSLLVSSSLVTEKLINYVTFLYCSGQLSRRRMTSEVQAVHASFTKHVIYDALVAFHIDTCVTRNAIQHKLSQIVTATALHSLCNSEHRAPTPSSKISSSHHPKMWRIEFPDNLFTSYVLEQQGTVEVGVCHRLVPKMRTFGMLLKSYCFVLFCTGYLVECAVVVAVALHDPSLAADLMSLHFSQAAANCHGTYRDADHNDFESKCGLQSCQAESVVNHTLIADKLIRVLADFVGDSVVKCISPEDIIHQLNHSSLCWNESFRKHNHPTNVDNSTEVGSGIFSTDDVEQVIGKCVFASLSGSAAFASDKLLEAVSPYLHKNII